MHHNFLLVLLLLVNPITSVLPHSQVSSLNDFYTATNGDTWLASTGWGDGDPCTNSWLGLVCDPSNSTLQEIRLPANNLVGTLIESPDFPDVAIMLVISYLNLHKPTVTMNLGTYKTI